MSRGRLPIAAVMAAVALLSQLSFFSTHPNPDHRIERIRAAIAKQFPQDVPAGYER